MKSPVKIVNADSPDLVAKAKVLFLEYARSLNFSLHFQHFDKELAELPGEYSPQTGRLLVALDGEEAIGCVALRKIDSTICEMKRLYVRPMCRGKGIGRQLGMEVIREAEEAGYTKMRLDTLTSMKEAVSLYRSLGFKEIKQYRPNPIHGALFMELFLKENDKPDLP